VRTRAELYRDFMGIKSLPGDEDFLRDDVGAGAGSRDGATPEALADASQFPLLAAQRASPRSPALAAQPSGAGAGAAASPAGRPAPPSFAFVAERGHTTMAFPTLAEASALNVRGKSGGGGGGGGGADGAAPRKGGAWGRP
jgi:hypothetical protein